MSENVSMASTSLQAASGHPTVKQAFNQRKWYDPVYVVGKFLGADQHDRATAPGRFLDSLPVIGSVNQFANPPSPPARYRPPAERRRRRVESDQRDPSVRVVNEHVGSEYPHGVAPSGDKFDATKGYEGEGPPSARTVARRARRKAAKAAKLTKAVVQQQPRGRKQKGVTPAATPQSARPSVGFLATQPKVQGVNMSTGTRLNGRIYAFTIDDLTHAFSSLWGGSGNIQPFFPLNPYALSAIGKAATVDTPIVSACDFKKRWTGVIKITYAAMCPQNTTGAIGVFVDPDAADQESSFLGTADVNQIAAEHSGKGHPSQVFQPFQSVSWTFRTSKPLWLRQSRNSDVRNTSLGNFYMYNQAIGAVATVGNVFIDYDIVLLDNSSNDRLLVAEGLLLGSNASPAAGFHGIVFTTWDSPKSETIQPCVNAPPNTTQIFTAFSKTLPENLSTGVCGFNLNVNDTTPCESYVEVVVEASCAGTTTLNTTSTLQLFLFLNGTDVSSTNVQSNLISSFIVNATATAAVGSWVVRIPPAALPGSLQLVPVINLTTASNTYSIGCWITPSVRFPTDWPTFSMRAAQLLRHHLQPADGDDTSDGRRSSFASEFEELKTGFALTKHGV